MPNAVHEDDPNFVGVGDDYRKNYAGVAGRPFTSSEPPEVLDRVKALETFRAVGVPYLGYEYMIGHPTTAKTPWDDRVDLDRKVIQAAGLTAQDVIDDH